jgi:hypothetical protein
MFPVKYKLDLYKKLRSGAVFKGLIISEIAGLAREITYSRAHEYHITSFGIEIRHLSLRTTHNKYLPVYYDKKSVA